MIVTSSSMVPGWCHEIAGTSRVRDEARLILPSTGRPEAWAGGERAAERPGRGWGRGPAPGAPCRITSTVTLPLKNYSRIRSDLCHD